MSGQLSAEWWIVFILINLFFGDGIRDDKKSYVQITCLTIIEDKQHVRSVYVDLSTVAKIEISDKDKKAFIFGGHK